MKEKDDREEKGIESWASLCEQCNAVHNTKA